MKVLKFGGTSVGSPERIRGVKRIIESQGSPCVIVVSAFQGVTDDLKQMSELASNRDDSYEILLEKLIVNMEDRAARIAEHMIDLLFLKTSDYNFRTSQLHDNFRNNTGNTRKRVTLPASPDLVKTLQDITGWASEQLRCTFHPLARHGGD